jgi:hypothetical protein
MSLSQPLWTESIGEILADARAYSYPALKAIYVPGQPRVELDLAYSSVVSMVRS